LAMIVLAGHTQMAFIAVVGLVVWVVGCELWVMGCELRVASRKSAVSDQHSASPLTPHVSRFLSCLLPLASCFLPFAIAGLIAAAQLLPTVELSRYSMRSGGLPWREAVSFSVRPWDLLRALIPPYFAPPLLPEAVAYIGLVGMALAAWGAWRVLRTVRLSSPQARQEYGLALILLAGVGLFCALGGYNPLYLVAVRLGVPGFVHFRVPARFLALYVLPAALLAGIGFESLFVTTETQRTQRKPAKNLRALRVSVLKLAPLALTVLIGAELLWAAEQMPHAGATAPRAYTDLRPATAHLVAAAREDTEHSLPPGRFLSITPTLFEAGDEADIDAVYRATLSAGARWAYQVAVKQREVLAPNLPLAFEVPAVDGYDGGLLPLRHYVAFSRLFLPEGTLDGRLRENLTTIPEARWLSLLGVRFLMTDKTGDAWIDGVFYDRQFQPHLNAGETLTLAWLPADFAADGLGWLYTGAGEVQITFTDGSTRTYPLSHQATAAGAYRLLLGDARSLAALTVRATVDGLTLSGASLIDGRTGAFYPLVLSDHFRLVHSGDVKIYENLHVLPRASLVQTVQCVDSDEAALAAMRAPGFDPSTQAVVTSCAMDSEALKRELPEATPGSATVVAYAPERVVVDVETHVPSWLMLTDVWFPGWHADVQPLVHDAGMAAHRDVLRTNLLFRGVRVDPGAWRITFTYRSTWLIVGIGLSVFGVIALIGYTYFICAIAHKRI